MKQLLEEDETTELAESAEAQFRTTLESALLQPLSLGEVRRGGGEPETVIERRPVLDWCCRFAKGDRWERVRGHDIWSRMIVTPDGRHVLEVSLRATFFSQIKFTPFATIGNTRFARLCRHYGVTNDGPEQKAQGRRVVILTEEFIGGLIIDPNKADPQNTEDKGQ